MSRKTITINKNTRVGHIRTRELIERKIKGCPHCGSAVFERNLRKGFHPFARFYCKKCKGLFFSPKFKHIRPVAM